MIYEIRKIIRNRPIFIVNGKWVNFYEVSLYRNVKPEYYDHLLKNNIRAIVAEIEYPHMIDYTISGKTNNGVVTITTDNVPSLGFMDRSGRQVYYIEGARFA